MPLGDGALAVAYSHRSKYGSVVLLHTEVAARAVRPRARIAIGAYRPSHRRDAIMVIAKCPFSLLTALPARVRRSPQC